MTSTAGTDEHPEVAEISALAEGLLPPERVADLRVHLADCVLCADVRDSLEEIRGLLGTLPGPPRMPEAVAARIDAALAAEALIHATRPEAAADATDTSADAVAAKDDTPPPAADTAHVSRETTPVVDRPLGHSGGSTGPGRTSRRARRSRRAFTAATSVAALILAGVVVHALHDDDNSPEATGRPSSTAGTFSGVALTDRVHQLLTLPGHAVAPNAGTQNGGNTPFSARTPLPPACVLKATGSADAPLGTAKGSYRGHTSYLVVLPHTADPERVDAYVVDASCAAAGSATAKGTVLTHEVYRRH